MNRLTDSPVFISLIGPNLIFAANAGCFLFVTLVLRQLKQPVRTSKILQKPGLSSFSTTQQVTRSRPLQVILARNFEFSLFISAIPSVLPNLGLKVLHFSSSDLGLLLTSMGIGSVIAAIIIQPWVRTHCRDNALMFSNSLVIIVYLTIGFFQQTQPLNLAAALAGAGWTLSASELWARGQAAIPDWARGRMTAAIITISQGATVLGGLTWAAWSQLPDLIKAS
jgi:predicted MFS family arabinose efflux permease